MSENMLPDDDILRYSRYLARKFTWILEARCDYSLEDLEVMAAMAIVQAVKDEGLETRKWVYMAPMHFKRILADELSIYRNWQRYEMEASRGKLQLNAPIDEDDDSQTLEEITADTEQPTQYSMIYTADICRILDEALARIEDDLTRECIMLHYMYQVPESDIAEALQCDEAEIRNRRNRGMRMLRNDWRLRRLIWENGLDEITPFYKGTGLAAWRASGLSAPERLTIWREEQQQRAEKKATNNA